MPLEGIHEISAFDPGVKLNIFLDGLAYLIVGKQALRFQVPQNVGADLKQEVHIYQKGGKEHVGIL